MERITWRSKWRGRRKEIPGETRSLADHLEYLFRHQLLVSGKVEIVDFQSLPRTETKVEDGCLINENKAVQRQDSAVS